MAVTAEAEPTQPDVAAREPVIRLVGIQKAFGDGGVILDGVDLDVYPNETLVIIGRSGTGKSVTLRHVIGLLEADEGEVYVFGQNLAELTKKELKRLRLKIGYLFQSGALINWLTIAENLALPLREHSPELTDDEIEAKVLEKLRLVEMAGAAEKYPAEISGGMRKRGGLARATILEPAIILYDEPTSGLDPVIATSIDELVIHTREALGVTQVVVTHDMESAYRIADRIAMLYEGKIIALGTPDEIRGHSSSIVQQFINGSSKGPITDMTEEGEDADKDEPKPSP